MAVVPAGGLVSFGPLSFDPVHTSGLIEYRLEWVNAYAVGPGRFPIDLRGLSSSPQKDPVATWKYLVVASPGLGPTEAGLDVEAKIGAIIAALGNDYAYTGSYSSAATLPGTLGDLVVGNVDGSAQYSCFARLDSTEVKLEPAKNLYAFLMPFTWHLLSDFVAA